MDGWNGRGRTGTKNKSSQESSATSWRETDRKERGADKLPDEGDEEDADADDPEKEDQETKAECLRNIKKHHNAFMIAQTEAKLRIGKFEGNMYQARSTHAQGPVGQGRQDPNGAV